MKSQIYLGFSEAQRNLFKVSANREKNKMNLFIFYSEMPPKLFKITAKFRFSEKNDNSLSFSNVRYLLKTREEYDLVLKRTKSSELVHYLFRAIAKLIWLYCININVHK